MRYSVTWLELRRDSITGTSNYSNYDAAHFLANSEFSNNLYGHAVLLSSQLLGCLRRPVSVLFCCFINTLCASFKF